MDSTRNGISMKKCNSEMTADRKKWQRKPVVPILLQVGSTKEEVGNCNDLLCTDGVFFLMIILEIIKMLLLDLLAHYKRDIKKTYTLLQLTYGLNDFPKHPDTYKKLYLTA